MKTNYFKNVATAEELKKAYRDLARELHPDLGGDEEKFKEMQAEYEILWDSLKDIHTAQDGSTYVNKSTETADEFMNRINTLLKYKDLTTEVCGKWIWVSGEAAKESKEYRDMLKSLKFVFSGAKKAWGWTMGIKPLNKKRRKSNLSMDYIRRKYGSEVYDSTTAGQFLLNA